MRDKRKRKGAAAERRRAPERSQKALMEKRKRRRTRRVIVALLIPLLVLAFISYYLITVYLRVDTIEVAGDSRYTAGQIEAASGVLAGDNLFLLDKEQVQHAVMSELPYVGSVTVRKKLPSTLQLTVSDTYPVEIIAAGDVYYLVDPEQKVLEVVEQTDGIRLPQVRDDHISGEPEPGEKLAFSDEISCKIHIDILKVLSDNNLLENITFVDLTDRLSLRVQYQDRIVIDFGDYLDLDAKAAFAAGIIRDKLSESDRGTLNVFDPEKGSFIADENVALLSADSAAPPVAETPEAGGDSGSVDGAGSAGSPENTAA